MGLCFSDDKTASGIKKSSKDLNNMRELNGAELIIDINP
jgi:hypothetical protein